jgi:uncharacterized protein (DUF885 family)
MAHITRIFILLSLIFTLFDCKQNSTTPVENKEISADEVKKQSAEANAFFDQVFDKMLDRHPMQLGYLGEKKRMDEWGDFSDTFAQEEIEMVKNDLATLNKTFDYNKLDEPTRLSYRLFEYEAKEKIEAFNWRFHNYPVNTQEGLHTEVVTFLSNNHPIDSLGDAKAYIARLQKVNRLFEQLLDNLHLREEKGIIPPKFVYPKVIAACKNVIRGQPFNKEVKLSSPLYADFWDKTEDLKTISQATRDSLRDQADQALLTSVKPAYEKLIAYLTELEKKATDTVGAWSWPQGDDYYEFAVRHNTTTDMSPEEVYQLGLKEVARIHGEIREVMKKVGFKNDNVTDFFRYVTSNKKFFYPNTEQGRKDYLKANTDYIETMKQHLDELFLTKPKADIEVRAVEEFREKSAGTAFYERPAPDGSRPGYFYANLYDMSQSPIYQIEALAYHEGIPGHHMQIAISQEMQGIPKFRRLGEGHTAYVEGWGLYAERIPKEIGFYKDPYSDFGRLSMELLRAARLVVDPGIHYKKWTREQAIQYFMNNTAEPPGECVNAIERYITWPGQATAYKIGMNKILDLRQRTKDKLKDKFNIREFHDVILLSGSLPLALLEENVDRWINKKLEG